MSQWEKPGCNLQVFIKQTLRMKILECKSRSQNEGQSPGNIFFLGIGTK